MIGRYVLATGLMLLAVSGSAQGNYQYSPEVTQGMIDSRTIDVSRPVGAIEATASVGSTGAANYTIPITLPPGMNGMAPNLAVSYNSQGGNGTMGMGWSLQGLSSIVRTGKDYFHDQTTGS